MFSHDIMKTMMASSSLFSSISNSSSPSPQSSLATHDPLREDESPPLVIRPCGACKGLRRRCVATCILAPYFPPTQPFKFWAVHRVFGASNVSKFLQGTPESQRADAVQSMVYEATTRIRDPVYGCAGVICSLQKHINQLQMELATTKAQLLNVTCQQEKENIGATNTCMEMKERRPSLEDFKNSEIFSWENSFFPFDDETDALGF